MWYANQLFHWGFSWAGTDFIWHHLSWTYTNRFILVRLNFRPNRNWEKIIVTKITSFFLRSLPWFVLSGQVTTYEEACDNLGTNDEWKKGTRSLLNIMKEKSCRTSLVPWKTRDVEQRQSDRTIILSRTIHPNFGCADDDAEKGTNFFKSVTYSALPGSAECWHLN